MLKLMDKLEPRDLGLAEQDFQVSNTGHMQASTHCRTVQLGVEASMTASISAPMPFE